MTFLNFQGQLWVQPPMPNKKMLKNPNKNEKNAKDMQRAMPKNAKKKHNTRPKKKLQKKQNQMLKKTPKMTNIDLQQPFS